MTLAFQTFNMEAIMQQIQQIVAKEMKKFRTKLALIDQ